MHMQTRVMAKGVKEALDGKLVIPNMDWLDCQWSYPVFVERGLYRGKSKGKEEYRDLNALVPTPISPENPGLLKLES
jgi:hypothetical protein